MTPPSPSQVRPANDRYTAAGGKADSKSKSVENLLKSTSGYQRIFGKRKQGLYSNSPDPLVNTSIFASFTDKFMGFLNRESSEERSIRNSLQWYKNYLLSEISLIKLAVGDHLEHGNALIIEFESQEYQLTKWGLNNVLQVFRQQAWCRVTRSAVLEEMARRTMQLLEARLERTNRIIDQFTQEVSTGSRKHELPVYHDFCQMAEKFIAKDAGLAAMTLRLARTDRICASYLHAFR